MDHSCTLVEVLAMLDLFFKGVAVQAKKISDGCTTRCNVDFIALELQKNGIEINVSLAYANDYDGQVNSCMSEQVYFFMHH